MSNKNDKVVSITKKMKLKTGYMGVASTEQLKRHLDEMNNHKKKEAMPYSDFIQEMNKKYILNRASTHFVAFKQKGLTNEVAHYYANDKAKSEAIISLTNEIFRLGKLFEQKEMTETHMLNLLKLASTFNQQIKFIDENKRNKYTHFLTDMEMLSEMSAEKKEELFGIKE